jgi:hypothetical protein
MCEPTTRVFFPVLARQGGYPRKADGSYYGYAHYRTHIAADCQSRCVYCDAKEDEVGGAEAMQLDHFRPEAFPEFEHLINDPLNLHYACARCNLWKSNYWPARGTPHTHDGTDGFVDPFVEDRLKYFSIRPDGQIEPLRPPASYIVGLLHLKREFLRKVREKRLLMVEWRALRIRLKAELQADLDAGRQTDQRKMLGFIETCEQIDAMLD